MKNTQWLVALLIMAACSKGFKKDFVTGLATTNNGLGVEEILIVDGNDQVMSSMEVPLDSRFSIVMQGISNYQLKDDKAFPGLSMSVTDASGKAVLDEPDLFQSSEDGYSAEDASVLRATVTVGNPMEAGQTYHCKVRVFDKNNAEAEIVAEVDFTVKP